ncbi:flavin-containing monooxygenase [Nocardioides bizhenqiangii]|uniref:NAD(P)-binding domain-containing protein n=1 Tax=Nocardioides bizhenqiangii TaxID=3095076 RepID=A0ABZ0ZVC5_9ACTN|nr:NAD(P)-binding domain-containing protein [Nocardioides sp. HM61]WQQ27779.1 NAD(P)-binding domain-containing protein [Nocardioides sp. HM61]
MTDFDVLVVGAGQAGLATGHALRGTGLRHLLLDAADDAGGSWPHYYDSLTLFSPARFSSLPGLPFEGDSGRYPAGSEVAAYLRSYAEHFAIPIRSASRVASVRTAPGSHFEVDLLDGQTLRARSVVAATGGFGNPYVPRVPGLEQYGGRAMHVAAYRRPDGFAGQRVVVVGAGNSAVQVAYELAHVADVTLATRNPVSLRRQQPLGVDLHYWVAWSGVDRLPLGRRAGGAVGVLDQGRYAAAIAAGRPDRREMFRAFTGAGVQWTDGPTEDVDAVIFATGYQPDLGYLPPEAFAGDGWPAHRRGVSTTSPGLGFVGVPGQTGLASATLRGVGPDARRVVRHLCQHLATRAAVGPVPEPVATLVASGRPQAP